MPLQQQQPIQSHAGPEEPPGPEPIPPLVNIAPSIFVPLQDDILTAEPPRDRIQRLEHILKAIDYQRQGVKDNLLYMFAREKTRIVQHAAEQERAQGPAKINTALAPAEADAVIANMEAPAAPGMDYNIRDMPLPPRTPIARDTSLRDRTVAELLNVVELGLAELQGFEDHMVGIKADYLDRLEKEMATIENVGKRLEERS
ncbi:hypothetical protein C8A05DRAFT_15051 [Staphylotrichum tortipilum]|uniref:Uncharacterized protein n=1 Tax=Staphylotrichum tortipilum TaxID=2831512 RepID=A0AAN6RUV8_9PEZI|nr:hypothetical protein C8A05DRAFT_15051 [Staphylotrichum longicolle]